MKRLWLPAMIGAAALLLWCVATRDVSQPHQPKQDGSKAELPATPEREAPDSAPALPPAAQPELAQGPQAQPAAPADPGAHPVLDPGKQPEQQRAPYPTAQGPVEALKASYQGDSRDSGAHAVEAGVEAAFKQPTVDPALLKSVVCHTSICKLELRWSARRAQGYLLAMMTTVRLFDQELAVAPVGEPSADGELAVEVYWRRKPAP